MGAKYRQQRRKLLAVSGKNLAIKTPWNLPVERQLKVEPHLGIQGLDIVEDNHEAGNMAVI
jgi:hypothetical protein